jgi:hypothetical protein
MFTIKRFDDVGWSLESASKVTFDAMTNLVTAHGVAGGGDKIYASGHIYVMNDFGKTVGVYDLDNKKQTLAQEKKNG